MDNTTRLVLANAVYFKANWMFPFDKRVTQEQPFHRPGAADVTAQLMHAVERHEYYETDTYQVVTLPYAHGPYEMAIWLPREVDGLDRLEAALAGEGAAGLDHLQRKRVNLLLPRFKVSGDTSLGKVLADMGMAGAFTRSADFSGITDEPLWISAVVHRALVEVDEEGTEAAAATAIVAVGTAAPAPEEIKVFRADHPFLFAIRNHDTGELLFMGRVVEPEN